MAGHTGYRAGLLETEYPWGFNVSYILTLVSVVYALSARHKKKPRNNKIKAVKPKETPMAIRSSFSRSPTNGKKGNQIRTEWRRSRSYVASHAEVLRGAGTHDEPLRTLVWEAILYVTQTDWVNLKSSDLQTRYWNGNKLSRTLVF